MNAHAVQRARERLGVELTAADERAALALIQSGKLESIPASDRRAWYELIIHDVPAWVLYDCGARSIVTVLDRRPCELGQPLPTLYALADEYGVSHAEAKRIAGREYEHLRHAHKSDRLTGMQAQKLRPLFEAAKKSEEVSMPALLTNYMNIRDTAELLGVSRDLIEKRVRELFPDKMKQGETTYLNEAEVTAVKLRIGQNSSLATSDDRRKLADMPKTALEKQLLIRQAMALQDEMIAELQGQLAIAAPKVEAFDRFLDASGSLCMQDAGKQLGLQPNKFIENMGTRGLLFKRGGKWIAKQEYIDRGWFVVRSVPRLDGGLSEQTRVTPAGLDALGKLYPREASA